MRRLPNWQGSREQTSPTKCGKNISSSLQGERLSISLGAPGASPWPDVRRPDQQSLLLLVVGLLNQRF
jgi:hypothetical protein